MKNAIICDNTYRDWAKRWTCFAKQQPRRASRYFSQPRDHFLAHLCMCLSSQTWSWCLQSESPYPAIKMRVGASFLPSFLVEPWPNYRLSFWSPSSTECPSLVHFPPPSYFPLFPWSTYWYSLLQSGSLNITYINDVIVLATFWCTSMHQGFGLDSGNATWSSMFIVPKHCMSLSSCSVATQPGLSSLRASKQSSTKHKKKVTITQCNDTIFKIVHDNKTQSFGSSNDI